MSFLYKIKLFIIPTIFFATIIFDNGINNNIRQYRKKSNEFLYLCSARLVMRKGGKEMKKDGIWIKYQDFYEYDQVVVKYYAYFLFSFFILFLLFYILVFVNCLAFKWKDITKLHVIIRERKGEKYVFTFCVHI